MDAEAAAAGVAMVAWADAAGVGALQGGNGHAAFYSIFCDVVFWVYNDAGHVAWADAGAWAGAVVHRK